jgi:hypothetical protein
MFLANSIKSLALGQYFFRGFRLGLRSKCATGQMVFEKALALAHEERAAFGTGAIVSFMQIDAGRLSDALPYLHLLWSGPATLIVATVMLCQFLGPSGLVRRFLFSFSRPLRLEPHPPRPLITTPLRSAHYNNTGRLSAPPPLTYFSFSPRYNYRLASSS